MRGSEKLDEISAFIEDADGRDLTIEQRHMQELRRMTLAQIRMVSLWIAEAWNHGFKKGEAQPPAKEQQ